MGPRLPCLVLALEEELEEVLVLELVEELVPVQELGLVREQALELAPELAQVQEQAREFRIS